MVGIFQISVPQIKFHSIVSDFRAVSQGTVFLSAYKGTPQSRTYTVNDITAILGIGHASAYKLANSGSSRRSAFPGSLLRIG